jgi:hypothetical protein
LLLFVVPLTLAVGTIVSNSGEIAARTRSLATFQMPLPHRWLADLPFVGSHRHGLGRAAAAGLEASGALFLCGSVTVVVAQAATSVLASVLITWRSRLCMRMARSRSACCASAAPRGSRRDLVYLVSAIRASRSASA